MAEAPRGTARSAPTAPGWAPWVPVALGLAVAGWLALAGPALSLRFSVRPAGLALAGGLVATLLWLTVRRVRGREHARVEAAVAAAVADEATRARADHDRFVGRLDHELKNPLTAIRAALAAHEGDPGAHLRTADEQAARLGAVVGDLRRLAELRTSPLELAPVDLPALLEDAVSALRGELSVRGEERVLRTQFPEAPWQLPAVTGDVDLLYLAVHNVLANARKFTGPGDLIEVRAADGDGFVEVDVADTGCGIPAAELDGVLDELARGSNARAVPGSGLGLAMVRTVVERHGGAVTLRSRVGEGTSVRLRLPLEPAG